jgi:CheY-like chemotaxis protein
MSPRTCAWSRLFSHRGYDVISATDGDGALELVASAKPDLVLLDVVMPQPDGYTACRRLRERVETAVLPVSWSRRARGRRRRRSKPTGRAVSIRTMEAGRQAIHLRV